MILTTVKTGEDLALGPDRPHPAAVVAAAITTSPADDHHTLDHLRPLPGGGPPHTALRGNVGETGAAPQALLAPPAPPPAPRPRLDLSLVLQPQPHDITKVTGEEIVPDQSLSTEVTGAVVEETGTDDHLLTRVEHMLMRTRPESTPIAVAAAGVVHLAGLVTAAGAETEAGVETGAGAETEAGAETGAGPAIIGRGAASGVESTRTEEKDLVVGKKIEITSNVT